MTMTAHTAGFQTSDLSLAAFLVSRGHGLLDVATVARGRKVFHFAPQVHEEAREFYQNALIPARAFANALRDLKALIRET